VQERLNEIAAERQLNMEQKIKSNQTTKEKEIKIMAQQNNSHKDMALMLVKFYNMQAGSANRLGDNPSRMQTVLDALDRGDIADLKNWIKEYVKNTKESDRKMLECFRQYRGYAKTEDVEVKDDVPEAEPEVEAEVTKEETPAPATTPAPVATQANATNSLGLLEQIVTELVTKISAEQIGMAITNKAQEEVRDFVKKEYGHIEKKIITVVNGVERPANGVLHDKFDTVMKFVANNEPVFLTGPAGSGKNVLCKQVAEALGLNFYFTNAVTQEYKLTGFTDAMGNYQPTQFYKAFTEGGVFMLDEMDASIPEVLVILNAAIANRYFDFPAPIGYVEAHPDFRVIAAGNTIGHGADFEYVGRNQLDAASLDRFALIEIDYCEEIEKNVANGDLDLVTFCEDFRNAANKAGVQIIISYRAIGRLAKMLQLLSITEALQTCLLKGLGKDSINMIRTEMHTVSKYTEALDAIIKAA